MSDKLPYIENEKGEFAVPCMIKISEDCVQLGKFCETKEEAKDWVEEECWIFSGEGWICLKCNAHFMRNLSQTRRDKGLDSMLPDGWDDNLETGINTVR